MKAGRVMLRVKNKKTIRPVRPMRPGEAELHTIWQGIAGLHTLGSGITMPPGINVPPGTFGKDNKCAPLEN